MAIDDKPFDEPDDDQLARLISSAYGAPEMRAEFARTLGERLDAKFAGRKASNVGLSRVNGVHRPSSDAASHSLDLAEAGAASDAVLYVEGASAASHNARRMERRRHIITGVIAASLLLAFSVWLDPPAWANVLRTIVHSVGEFAFGDGNDDDAPSDIVVEEPGSEAPPPGDEIVASKPEARFDVEMRAIGPGPGKTSADEDKNQRAPGNGKPLAREMEAWAPFKVAAPPNELARQVDELLVGLWQKSGIQPVGEATDAEFMRRVYLDLTGRIPRVSEVQAFLEDPSPDRRELLVDGLLSHRDHATHLAAVWREVLLPSDVDLTRLGGPAKFEEWLAERFAANVGYDQIVRELLLAEGRVSESGPLLFYAALKLNPEELAARTSRAFLGMRMECAQCHDHPFDEVTQNDFWSFAAFFARISRPRGKMEMTSPVLQVRDNEQGDVTIPESDEVVQPRLPLTGTDVENAPEGPPRREQLVQWLTAANNGHFARASANRAWAHLFGRGLVEPVDDMRPANPPIAPEVLDTLSRDFAASGFNLRRLLRELVLTRAYQLSSQSATDDPSRTLHFAQMNIKSFTAEQLYDCLSVAAGQKQQPTRTSELAGIDRFSDMSRQAFVGQFRAAPGQATDYQAGIPQALTLMHGGLIHSATDLGTSGLLKSLAAPFFTDEQRLDTLFLSTLSRYPEPAEREAMLELIAAAANDREKQQALGDVLWALLNSAEFTFNH